MDIKSSVPSLFSLEFKNPKKGRRSSSFCCHNNQTNIILLQPEGKSFSLLKR